MHPSRQRQTTREESYDTLSFILHLRTSAKMIMLQKSCGQLLPLVSFPSTLGHRTFTTTCLTILSSTFETLHPYRCWLSTCSRWHPIEACTNHIIVGGNNPHCRHPSSKSTILPALTPSAACADGPMPRNVAWGGTMVIRQLKI